MSQYCIWFYEIQIQLNVLYFYSQNLATPRITPKLRNWHQYNIENWTIDLIPFSPFLYVCLCRHIHSLLFFFFLFQKQEPKESEDFCNAELTTAASSHCLVFPGPSGSPKSLAGLPEVVETGQFRSCSCLENSISFPPARGRFSTWFSCLVIFPRPWSPVWIATLVLCNRKKSQIPFRAVIYILQPAIP